LLIGDQSHQRNRITNQQSINNQQSEISNLSV